VPERVVSPHSPWIYTMHRCDSSCRQLAVAFLARAARSTTALALLAFAAAAAQAQALAVNRNFPATALRGEIAVVQPPELLLNGRPARLAPGARIRDENNMLALTGALAGKRLVVHYTVDLSGLVADIWVLTPAERARLPWPVSREQAAAWSFDPVAQVWTKP
jgi:hypothetical protein